MNTAMNLKLIIPEPSSTELKRQPLSAKSINLCPIAAFDDRFSDTSCEVKADILVEKENAAEMENNLTPESIAESILPISIAVVSSGDESLAAKFTDLSLEGFQTSKLEEHQPVQVIRNRPPSAIIVDHAVSEDGAASLDYPVSTQTNIQTSTIDGSQISTPPDSSSCVLGNENDDDARGYSTKRLRSARINKAVVENDSAKKPHLNKETCADLAPLTTLEGVSSIIKDIDCWYNEWTTHCHVIKIAEGSFGSVFRLSDKEGLQKATIGKLMPLRPKSGKGSRKAGFSRISDAASEIRLLETMSHVPGFVEFRSAEVLIGALPKVLKREYCMYKTRCISIKRSICEVSYPENQMWVFIEMGNAGIELEDALLPEMEKNSILGKNEHGQWTLGIRDTRDIFWGVAEALANGEEAQEFEHRDLHFSNICIQRKPHKSENGYLLIPPCANIEVTLIDYTLSRATLENGEVVCNRITDKDIFEGEDDLQFDLYRWMRDEMPGQDLQRKEWDAFVPITNVLWLYHLLEKLMLQTAWPNQNQDEKALWDSLKELKNQLNPEIKWNSHCNSAMDVVNNARQMDKAGREQNADIEHNIPQAGKPIDEDLIARFECVKI